MTNVDLNIFISTAKWLNQSGWPGEAHQLTASTSDLAKAGAFTDPIRKIYIAETQTGGRGRRANDWTSPPPGSSLMATWSFEVPDSPQPLCAPLIGLAVYQAAQTHWPELPWSVKPPNDIYLSDRKAAGLLVESVSRGRQHRLLVGFGFNIHAAPDVPAAGHAGQFFRQPLKEDLWHRFLTELNQGLFLAAELSAAMALTPAQRLALTDAIRRHPAHTDLSDVTMEGNLIYPNRKIAWHDL
jgi:BirA family transcriptional regulator, biotin operon repressor / biotin---[acetyl-CoA-carboxylase] ligase